MMSLFLMTSLQWCPCSWWRHCNDSLVPDDVIAMMSLFLMTSPLRCPCSWWRHCYDVVFLMTSMIWDFTCVAAVDHVQLCHFFDTDTIGRGNYFSSGTGTLHGLNNVNGKRYRMTSTGTVYVCTVPVPYTGMPYFLVIPVFHYILL